MTSFEIFVLISIVAQSANLFTIFLKPKDLLTRTIYHHAVDTDGHSYKGMKMTMDESFRTNKYYDSRYKSYGGLADSKSYAIPQPYEKKPGPVQDNRMVSHILENIVRNRDREQKGDGIDDLFQDRLGLIRSKIELILLQLEERKRISEEILYQMERDSCKVQNLIFEMGPLAYDINRERLSLEQTKLDLENQKRREEVGCFRDTGLLNQDLKDALIQYLGEVQKNSILSCEVENDSLQRR